MKDLLIQLKNELKFIQSLVQQIEDLENSPPFIPDPPKQTDTYIDGGTP